VQIPEPKVILTSMVETLITVADVILLMVLIINLV